MASAAKRYGIEVRERRDLAMIAVQGPNARTKAAPLLGPRRDLALALEPFTAAAIDDLFVARTGYTGEDGWEIIVPAVRAARFWDDLAAAAIAPCGLGARDTLRLEAGMNLYGADMDEQTTPLESGLAWTVALATPGRNFIGRRALEAQRAAAQARRPPARRPWRAARASTRHHGGGRRRSDERHLLADHAALGRAGARADRSRRARRGGDQRQAPAGRCREAAVRAQWRGAGHGVTSARDQ
jgi:aminomethyltransferase